jgi:tRNA-dihydrouridine synthase 3
LSKELQGLLRKKNYDFKKKESLVAGDLSNDAPQRPNASYPSKTIKLVDFSNKVYVAPLTTVGNLPFRRVLKEFGADITCGEMAMTYNLMQGQASEWALLRRHQSEDVFGIQMAGNQADVMGKMAQIIENEVSCDFVDLNCGCPIDVVTNRGCGSALMTKPSKLCDIITSMTKHLSCPVTVKIRTGWACNEPTAHKLIPKLQQISKGKIAAIFIHGRSRQQRYTKTANWEYILDAARSQNPALPRIPIIGNGDIFSIEDWQNHQKLMEINREDNDYGLCNCAMIGRGALIKPWLPKEIKENRHIDISSSERLDMLKSFCNYGLEHWGSDQQGINTIRRFLLEWLSFLCRYVPSGLVERTQKMQQRPPQYFGRCDMETLMASTNPQDWVRITELLLGPVPSDFHFSPKHKSNGYAASEGDMTSNG